MFRRLAPLLRFLAATIIVLAVIDVALFRSGVYARLIKPDSTAGSVVGAMMAIERYYDPTRKNVLVLGNSQIGEGFSAQIADTQSGQPELHFVNGSVAGTTPRVWDYMLRETDPDARHFSAIVMMVDYDLAHTSNDFTNYPLDVSYTSPLLRLADLCEFPDSFRNEQLRQRARRAILLPMQGLHDDVADLLAHPLQRFHELFKVRPEWLKAVGYYGGREGALPSFAIDGATGGPKDWGADEATWRPQLGQYFENLAKPASQAIQSANAAYQRLWVSRIAERYRANGTAVIVFNMARGPWKAELLPTPALNVALSEMRDAGRIVALPGDAFIELEKPQFFIDTLHLNSVGREKFSKLFAMQVAPLVR